MEAAGFHSLHALRLVKRQRGENVDLVPELLDAVQRHLRTLGFEVNAAEDGPDRGVDLTLNHRATEVLVNVVVSSTQRRTHLLIYHLARQS